MSDYIREYSAGELVTTSVSIYRQHFLVLFLVYILPTVPAFVLSNSIKHINPTDPVFVLTSTFVQQIIGLLVVAPITVAVSDICLGNQPSLQRSYLRPFDVIGKLAGTYILVNVIIFVGYMLLIVPGIIVTVMLMFAITTVVLERLGPVAAMRRSAHLGKGSYWRNIGVLLLIGIIIAVPVIIIMVVSMLIMGEDMGGTIAAPWLEHLISVLSAFVAPLFFIVIVLLYYDMRVRKENYDATALTQDFMG